MFLSRAGSSPVQYNSVPPDVYYYRHQCRYLVGLLIFFASLFYIKIFFFSLLLSVSCWAIDCICCCCVDLQRRRVAFKHTLIVYWFKNKKFTSPSVDQRKVHWCPFLSSPTVSTCPMLPRPAALNTKQKEEKENQWLYFRAGCSNFVTVRGVKWSHLWAEEATAYPALDAGCFECCLFSTSCFISGSRNVLVTSGCLSLLLSCSLSGAICEWMRELRATSYNAK